jgi:hypothetical protein
MTIIIIMNTNGYQRAHKKKTIQWGESRCNVNKNNMVLVWFGKEFISEKTVYM